MLPGRCKFSKSGLISIENGTKTAYMKAVDDDALSNQLSCQISAQLATSRVPNLFLGYSTYLFIRISKVISTRFTPSISLLQLNLLTSFEFNPKW